MRDFTSAQVLPFVIHAYQIAAAAEPRYGEKRHRYHRNRILKIVAGLMDLTDAQMSYETAPGNYRVYHRVGACLELLRSARLLNGGGKHKKTGIWTPYPELLGLDPYAEETAEMVRERRGQVPEDILERVRARVMELWRAGADEEELLTTFDQLLQDSDDAGEEGRNAGTGIRSA